MYNTMDWVPAEKRSAVAAETARGDVATCLKVLDGGLAGRSFLLGEYTLADTHVHSIVGWLGMMHIDLSPYANVGAWMKRCAERPAIAKMMAG
jgi:glutathione S-transferase